MAACDCCGCNFRGASPWHSPKGREWGALPSDLWDEIRLAGTLCSCNLYWCPKCLYGDEAFHCLEIMRRKGIGVAMVKKKRHGNTQSQG